MKGSKPDVPVAILSGDECLPLRDLEAVDCFMSKSQPIVSFLEKVDYLLSRTLPVPTLRRFEGSSRRLREHAPDSRRSMGISMKNEGIQKTL